MDNTSFADGSSTRNFPSHKSLGGLIANTCRLHSLLSDDELGLLIHSRASFSIWRSLLQKSSRELWSLVKSDIRKESKMVVCSFFQQGRCKFGGRVNPFESQFFRSYFLTVGGRFTDHWIRTLQIRAPRPIKFRLREPLWSPVWRRWWWRLRRYAFLLIHFRFHLCSASPETSECFVFQT